MMGRQSVKDKYFVLLKAHITRPEEEQLAEAAGLGRELVRLNVPPEEIGEIHEEALKRLAKTYPDVQALDTVRRASAPLMEMLLFYGLTFRKQLEERKRVEGALKKSEIRLAEAQRIAHLGNWDWDIVENNLYWSDEIYRIFGFKPREFVAGFESFLNSVHQDDRELVKLAVNRVLYENKPYSIEYRIVLPDGTERVVCEQTEVTFDDSGKPIRIFGTVHDITERRRVEEEQIWLVTAVEQAAEAVVITDTDGTIRYVNPAFESITGFSREEAIGQNHRIIKSGEHNEDFYRELWGTITQGRVWIGHFTNRKKDGTLYEENATISPIRNASGKIVKYVAVKRDVTQEVALEAQFHQAQKMEAIGRLAGGVAHDFNNMLNVILVYSGFVKEELPPGDPWREDIEEIERAARRAANLTRSLLAFSRRQIMSSQPLNLNEVIRGLGKMLEKFIGEDIELKLNLDENLWIVSADWSQIELALMNLVVNARDAMPRGGRITIETSNVVLDENYAEQHKVDVPPGPYVLLAVNDTGHGMTKEIREHIFEPFFTTKDIDKGTGLGLATVYGIVKQSNGYIWVYSEPGMGTSFKIYLPETERTVEKITEEEPLVSYPPANGKTILLVEDDEGIRKAASRILSGGGYKVIEAGDPSEAEKKFKEKADRISLLLTDVVMPHGNGHELAQKLTGINPQLKVLYMSGYSEEIIAHHGILQEGIRVVQKPFPARELLKQVREILEK